MSLQEMQAIENAVWQITRLRCAAKIAAHPMGVTAMAQSIDEESQPVDPCFAAWADAHAEQHAIRDAVRRAFLPRREELSRAANAPFNVKDVI